MKKKYHAQPIHDETKRFCFLLPFYFEDVNEFRRMHSVSRNSTTSRFKAYEITEVKMPVHKLLFEISKEELTSGKLEKLKELFEHEE